MNTSTCTNTHFAIVYTSLLMMDNVTLSKLLVEEVGSATRHNNPRKVYITSILFRSRINVPRWISTWLMNAIIAMKTHYQKIPFHRSDATQYAFDMCLKDSQNLFAISQILHFPSRLLNGTVISMRTACFVQFHICCKLKIKHIEMMYRVTMSRLQCKVFSDSVVKLTLT